MRISVYQQPEMTTETRVSERGTLSVPMAGAVPVAGATASQVEQRIAALLTGKGQMRDPQVTVTVLKFNSRQVSVLGMVSRPGRYALEEGVYRLTDILSLAGGVLPEGADTVTLVRTADGKSQRLEVDLRSLFKAGDFSDNPVIAAGDSIYVDRAPKFYVYGEVNKPGVYRVEKDMTLMQAISVGGGLTERGTDEKVQIRRRKGSGYETLRSGLAERLQPDDVVFVRESVF